MDLQSRIIWLMLKCSLLLISFLHLIDFSSTLSEDSIQDVPLLPYNEKELQKHMNNNSQLSRTEIAVMDTAPFHKKKSHDLFIREVDVTDSILGSGSTPEQPTSSCLVSDSGSFCPPDIDSQYQYLWPSIHIGETQTGKCFGNTALATRNCTSSCLWDQVNCSVSDGLLSLFQSLYSQNTITTVQDLRNITKHMDRRPEPLSEIYLMHRLVSQATIQGERVSQMFQQSFVEICSNILERQYREQSILLIPEMERYQAGTLLLQTMNKFGLFAVNTTDRMIILTKSQNIEMKVCSSASSTSSLECSFATDQRNSTSSVAVQTNVYSNFDKASIALFVYTNLTGYLPEGRDNSSDIKLATSVVSYDVQCDEDRCNNVTSINSTVIVTFYHGTDLKELLASNAALKTTCVYWESPITEWIGSVANDDGPHYGYWSDVGCMKNTQLSNVSYTVCNCNKPGVFAAVLSQPEVITEKHRLALKIIFSVGTCLSLVGLIITAATFIGFRSLWSMQGGIHVQLCIILSLDVLSFAVGGEYANNLSLCTTFAVLKHYFFTVTLMWILIDGIVLLLLSTTTFVYKVRYYLAGFTIVAYGAPLLYMCVCIPLGLLLWNKELWGYGEPYGCFLRLETNFFLAYFVPVVVILMATAVIFGITLVISCNLHWRPQETSNKRPSFQSLFTHAALLTYFTLTLLILPFSNIAALLYLSTIMVSFNGLFIFILYVPCIKQVRENFSHCASQNFVRSKHMIIIRNFEAPHLPDHVKEEEGPAIATFRKTVCSSMYEASRNDEVHQNPLAIEKEVEEKDGDFLSPHSMSTKTAMNPSDVSLWRIAHRASNGRELKLQPTIEELEEKATVVTFL